MEDKKVIEEVKGMIEQMVKLMVESVDKVVVNSYSSSGYLFEVVVDEKDFGKVIGKKGRIAQSVRVILNAIGGKINKKIIVNFLYCGNRKTGDKSIRKQENSRVKSV